jgi:hypothetical protein
MKTMTFVLSPILLLIFISMMSCRSATIGATVFDPSGVWASRSDDGMTLLQFLPDGTGAVISAGNGSAIGAPFTYSVTGDTVTMVPETPNTQSFAATITGRELNIVLPRGKSTVRRVDKDDPTYSAYIKQMNEYLTRHRATRP